MRHQAAVLPKGHDAAGGHLLLLHKWEVIKLGGSLVQEMPILWGQTARRLTGKGRAELPQSTALAALTPFNDYLFN